MAGKANQCNDYEDTRPSSQSIEMPGTTTTILNEIQINILPDEIIEFILTYLPPYKDLENCSLVCKRWLEIVRNVIRRSKNNLQKGLLDFRLHWEIYSQQTAASIEMHANHALTNGNAMNWPSKNPNSPVQPIIAGRFSHSAVRHGNSMYVFGGGSSSDTTFNDLWRFDLSNTRWERPLSMGSYPSPKGSASMVCWRDQLVLFGGWRYPSLHPPYQPWCLFDELHYYDIKSNRWTVRSPMPCPPAMAGHSATVHGNIMVVFGGYQIADGVNSNSNETWCLDLEKQKWWKPRFVGNTKPPSRYGQIQLELDEHHLLIVGGCGGANSIYSDAWVLDMTNDHWIWRSITVKNKKFGASHMWCNPACKIDKKLVVLGPTPNMPQDFQMMKHARMPLGGGAMPEPAVAPNNNRLNQLERRGVFGGLVQQRNGVGMGGGGGGGGANGRLHIEIIAEFRAQNNRMGNLQRLNGQDDQYYANRRAILNQHQQNANHNLLLNNLANPNNNNVQPRTGRLSELHAPPPPAPAAAPAAAAADEQNQNRPSLSNSGRPNGHNDANGTHKLNDVEAANRLQRNLALGCRDNEPLLPKRFDELYEDPIRMAAFNVPRGPRSVSKDHNERIRRMEEKMNALRNSRRNITAKIVQKSIKEPSPKRVKRNVLSLFVCDLSGALDAKEPSIEWIEYKNYGIIPGAPERLILSSMVAGNGELILFGGVHKETLSEITHQVSNAVHFLSATRDIV